MLFDQIVMISHRGDLRQMGDADHLLFRRKRRKLLADTLRRNAGYTGVNLVEHHGGNRIAPGKNIFQREHDAAELTAGGDMADASGRFSGICG